MTISRSSTGASSSRMVSRASLNYCMDAERIKQVVKVAMIFEGLAMMRLKKILSTRNRLLVISGQRDSFRLSRA